MSEWNLSVRLTGEGTGLRRTLKDVSREAKTGSRNVNALKDDIAALRREASNDIRIRLDVDAGSLRSDVSAALSSAGAGQGLAVNLSLGNSMSLRREVENAVRWASWGHRINIPIGLADPMQLRRDVSAAVRWASDNQTIRIRVQPDTTALRGLGGSLSGGSGGGGGANFGLGSLIPLATAAIPLIAGLASSLAPLAGTFAATGGAAAAFGVALAGQIGPLQEAAEAERAYQDAVSEHGQASAEAAQAQLAYQRRLAAMPPETQKAAVALGTLKDEFGDWSDEMSQFTMEPVTKSFVVLQELLPHLSPEVESFSGSMDRLMDVVGGAIQTPGFDALSDRVAELTDSSLDAFTDQVVHLLRVVSEGRATDGALGQILDYARENGPEAREALRAVADAVGTVAEGAADAGPAMLTLVTAVANLVGALPPEVVTVVIQLAAALKLASLAAAGAAAASAGVTRLSTAVATLGATSAAAGGGIAGLRAAVASLGTGAKFGLAAAGVTALVLALHELSDNKPAVQVDELSTSLNTLISTGKVTGTLSTNMDEMASSIAMVSKEASDNKLAQWTTDFGTWVGIATGPGISTARENVDAWDKSMANLVKAGHPREAAKQYELLKSAWKAGGGDVERLKKFTTDYSNALADQKWEQEQVAKSMGGFGAAAQETAAKLNAQKTAADGLRAALVDLNQVNRDAYSAQLNYEQAIDDLTASFKENGATLDSTTDAGRRNGEAMVAMAQAQDQLIVTGVAAGDSFTSMKGKSEELRASMMALAVDAFDGNKKKATEYINTLLGTPKQVDTLIKAEYEGAVAGLESVRTAIQETPGSKTVTVDTLNAAAIAALEAVGLKTRTLEDGRTEVYTANGQALGSIGAVSTALNNLNGDTAYTYTVHTTSYRISGSPNVPDGNYSGSTAGRSADGNIYGPVRLSAYADGGMRENHVAQIAQPTFRMWAEPETGGEAYIPFATSKRPRSRAIAEETVRRLGGDPAAIQWNADGGISNWAYDPISGSLYSPSDAAAAGKKTRKVKGKDVAYYDLGAVERKLWDMGEATAAWNRNLEKVADRAGGDVARSLASMGEDGMKIAAKMATGTDKYVAQMSIALRNLEKTARASLKDFTQQLDHATGNNSVFQNNLAKLAAMGYGDLASHLAAQGDEASMQLAAEAAGSKSKAKKANDEVKQAKAQLTPDEMGKLIEIIAALTNKNVGIHQVADKTGLGEDEIIEVGNKAKLKLMQLLGAKAFRFLQDLAKANKGAAYENGGIRAGLYATQGGIVRFAEPSTRGEAYIPLGANKRASATRVLGNVASRFGLGLTDASSGRVTVIRQEAPLIGQQTNNVTSGGSAKDAAREIEHRFGYQLRRISRGGVASRGR